MKKILFVDDEPNVLAALQRHLRKQFTVETAVGSREGLATLQNSGDIAVVVADMRMPEMNGVEFLSTASKVAPDVVRLMLTGNADQTTAIDAINEGHIFRFLNKPCSPEKMAESLEAAVRQHELIIAERELLENTLHGSIKVLSEILSLTDPESFGHTEALRNDMRAVGNYLKLPRVWELEVAAMLSQIGNVAIPPELLIKIRTGFQLTAGEQEMIQRSPAVGGNLLSQIPRMGEVSKIILYQNKRFDGTGFPNDAIANKNIPLGARILKVLGDLAQLQNNGTTRSEALAKLRGRPGFYDPQILDATGACFNIDAEGQVPAKPPLALGFNSLRVGLVLVSDILTLDGTMIIAAGNRITPAVMQRLRNFSTLSGISEPIYVEA